ncbi:MAG: hypothetical protein ISS87_00510, partial [Candidatus Pacebacteria bacterium]|nr:hypothetical protein [Candidatus Paceibacterota bacterium]
MMSQSLRQATPTADLLYQEKGNFPTKEAVWTKVIYLEIGDEIAVVNEISEVVSQARSAAEGEGGDATSEILFEKIVSIEYVGYEQVYDIEVENTHNFIANEIFAHNTYFSDNVGIGTTNPAYTLEVIGDAGISTDLTVGGGDIDVSGEAA